MEQLNVVAAIIWRNGAVLATQRGYGEFAGKWEFPGGKIEHGETPEDALMREVDEELGVGIGVDAPLCVVEHEYPEFRLHMSCYLVHVTSGRVELREHEAARWVDAKGIDNLDWLPADVKVVQAIKRQGILG